MMHFIPSYTLEGFHLGPFYIYTWGLTAALGVLLAIFLASKKIARYSLSENLFWNFSILLTLSVFLGARISYILETWSYYASDPAQIYQIWNGGFSFFGGAVGGILCGYLWAKKNKLNFLDLGAIFTPAWIFGLLIGRIGCFLIHDHLGKTTGLPWGIWTRGAYRHEPAMYEALMLLTIAAFLYLYKKINTLMIFPISLALYSFGRFWLDFLRENPPNGGDDRYWQLTVAQWISILIILAFGIIYYLWGFYNYEKEKEQK